MNHTQAPASVVLPPYKGPEHPFDDGMPDWIRSIAVGDVVCNCNYQHRRVSNIVDEVWPRPTPGWLDRIIDVLPGRLGIMLDDAVRATFVRLGMCRIVDRQLFFADGSTYYARPCCSLGDHEPFEGDPCDRSGL